MATLFTESKRRNVFRVGAFYLVASWQVIEVASVLLDNYAAPVREAPPGLFEETPV